MVKFQVDLYLSRLELLDTILAGIGPLERAISATCCSAPLTRKNWLLTTLALDISAPTTFVYAVIVVFCPETNWLYSIPSHLHASGLKGGLVGVGEGLTEHLLLMQRKL